MKTTQSKLDYILDTAGTVKLYNTVIVAWNMKHIRLNTGGWGTKTTKRQMNKVSEKYGLGFKVEVKNYKWCVTYKGKEIPFTNEVLLLKR